MSRKEALLVGVAMGAVASVLAYAAVRAIEASLFVEPNPATIIWSERSAFVWRAAIALYLGGACTFAGFVAARRSGELAARALFALVSVAVFAILLQGALWP
jgi:hypothetical protein